MDTDNGHRSLGGCSASQPVAKAPPVDRHRRLWGRRYFSYFSTIAGCYLGVYNSLWLAFSWVRGAASGGPPAAFPGSVGLWPAPVTVNAPTFAVLILGGFGLMALGALLGPPGPKSPTVTPPSTNG